MRQIIVPLAIVLFSCSGDHLQQFELTKSEAKNSFIYPIGMKLAYPETFEEVPVSGETTKAFWVILKGPNSDFTVSALTDTNFSVSVNKYLIDEANAFAKRNTAAQIVGTTNELFGPQRITFIHLTGSNSIIHDHCNAFSLGVLEFGKYQFQIQINERLESTESVSNFITRDIRVILNSIELE